MLHDDDARAMLAALGLSSCEDLFRHIPESARPTRALSFEGPLTESELVRRASELASHDLDAETAVCFAGGGIYDRFRPAIVDWIIQRGEFLTSYTSYQAEISQGFLTAMYEFQSLVCELYAMDVANASVYDAGSGLAEAVLVAMVAAKRDKALVLEPLHPGYAACIRTAVGSGSERPEEPRGGVAKGGSLASVPMSEGGVDLAALERALDAETACVVVQQPSYLGTIEDLGAIVERAHAAGAKAVVACDPVATGLLEPPGKLGADLVVGEGQGLGIPMGLGGPGVGLFSARRDLLRLLPGRIVGRTVDAAGKPGYVLTLQTREQHIRREKAASNICTNQGLCALAATVHLCALGPDGLAEAAALSTLRAHELRDALVGSGLEPLYGRPFFQEFAVRSRLPVPRLQQALGERGWIVGQSIEGVTGVPNSLLLAATERRTPDEIEGFARAVKEVLADA